MENIQNLILTAGIIILAVFSMKLSHEAMETMNQMNHQIQMMFVKS